MDEVAAPGYPVRQWQEAGVGPRAWNPSPQGSGEASCCFQCLETQQSRVQPQKPCPPRTNMDQSH